MTESNAGDALVDARPDHVLQSAGDSVILKCNEMEMVSDNDLGSRLVNADGATHTCSKPGPASAAIFAPALLFVTKIHRRMH